MQTQRREIGREKNREETIYYTIVNRIFPYITEIHSPKNKKKRASSEFRYDNSWSLYLAIWMLRSLYV